MASRTADEQRRSDSASVASGGKADGDDFWEWFDAPVEVPDRARRRVETVAEPPQSTQRRVVGLLGWAVVISAFVVAALLVLPLMAGMKVLAVQSGSMSPAIDAGDAVIVRTVFAADLKPGHVVTYRPPSSPGDLVTHRVVSIELDQRIGDFVVITKGDANRTPDESWRAARNDQFGEVVLTLPELGHVQNWLAGTRGKLLALIALVTFIVAGSLSRRRAQRIAGLAETPAP